MHRNQVLSCKSTIYVYAITLLIMQQHHLYYYHQGKVISKTKVSCRSSANFQKPILKLIRI